ncbi:unnamed protein product [Closterium sp. Naga37s-1]|nr:unnamed protein product [Closterium sp. Naga37s-1]
MRAAIQRTVLLRAGLADLVAQEPQCEEAVVGQEKEGEREKAPEAPQKRAAIQRTLLLRAGLADLVARVLQRGEEAVTAREPQHEEAMVGQEKEGDREGDFEAPQKGAAIHPRLLLRAGLTDLVAREPQQREEPVTALEHLREEAVVGQEKEGEREGAFEAPQKRAAIHRTLLQRSGLANLVARAAQREEAVTAGEPQHEKDLVARAPQQPKEAVTAQEHHHEEAVVGREKEGEREGAFEAPQKRAAIHRTLLLRAGLADLVAREPQQREVAVTAREHQHEEAVVGKEEGGEREGAFEVPQNQEGGPTVIVLRHAGGGVAPKESRGGGKRERRLKEVLAGGKEEEGEEGDVVEVTAVGKRRRVGLAGSGTRGWADGSGEDKKEGQRGQVSRSWLSNEVDMAEARRRQGGEEVKEDGRMKEVGLGDGEHLRVPRGCGREEEMGDEGGLQETGEAQGESGGCKESSGVRVDAGHEVACGEHELACEGHVLMSDSPDGDDDAAAAPTALTPPPPPPVAGASVATAAAAADHDIDGNGAAANKACGGTGFIAYNWRRGQGNEHAAVARKLGEGGKACGGGGMATTAAAASDDDNDGDGHAARMACGGTGVVTYKRRGRLGGKHAAASNGRVAGASKHGPGGKACGMRDGTREGTSADTCDGGNGGEGGEEDDGESEGGQGVGGVCGSSEAGKLADAAIVCISDSPVERAEEEEEEGKEEEQEASRDASIQVGDRSLVAQHVPCAVGVAIAGVREGVSL